MQNLKSRRFAPALYPRPLGLAQFFDRMPAFGAALRHAREGSRQYQWLMEAVPQRLARFVVAMAASGSTVVLTVDSPEAAHLARLLGRDMLANLHRKGGKFSEISVRTQSKPVPRRLPKTLPSATSQRDMSAVASRMKSERMQTSLARLAKTIADR
ncbi:MAG: hypothetical protein JNL19_13345 [Burkholderiales bacterium]|nr:hypothetical protein [Burkholderiales bacterium]